MHRLWHRVACWGCAVVWALPMVARGDDNSALDLQVQAEAPQKAAQRPLRLFLEAVGGRISQRYGLPHEDARRVSLDFSWETRPAPQWRFVFSDRLDDIHPVEPGGRSTLNSVREAYVGWQDEPGQLALDFGRVNLRNGPAYGFNPTDYFRDGASRAVTTADPLALRENRLGTVMVRAQRLGSRGSVSLVLAPKLESAPSQKSFSLDLGATNHADRGLVVVSGQTAGNVSGQAFAFYERGKGAQLGANATALIGDAAVGFVEWSGGRDADLLSETFAAPVKIVTRHRAAVGATYTTESRLALTMEFEYNGFAASRSEWDSLAATGGAEALGAYLFHVQQRQDIASRRAVMVYASQKDAFVKNVDLTALLRVNAQDHSKFAWVEARYHRPRFDVALQWQMNSGRAASEYGVVTARRIVQLLAAVYF